MTSQSPASESLEVRMARQEGALPFLATKADISELRGEVKALHAEMKNCALVHCSAGGGAERTHVRVQRHRIADSLTDRLPHRAFCTARSLFVW